MADTGSYSGDEYTDDEEDGEELDPRVQVCLSTQSYKASGRSRPSFNKILCCYSIPGRT